MAARIGQGNGSRRLRYWGAIALLCSTFPLVPAATSHAYRPASMGNSAVCQGTQPVAADHPDVKILQSLVRKYDVRLPVSLSFDGDRPLTKFQFAQILMLVQRQARQLNDGERQTLARLLDRYDLAQYTRRRRRYSSSGRAFLGQMPSGGSRTNSAIPSIAPLPVGRPAPKPLPSAVPQPALQLAKPSSAADTASVREATENPAVRQPTAKKIMPPRPDGRIAPRPRPNEPWRQPQQPGNTEGYSAITENPFLRPANRPLSTFSIDVDTAAYSNMRRFIDRGQMPPKDAIRVEEMINYFAYDYARPSGDQPFSVNTAVTTSPWNAQNKLVRIGLQGKQLETPPPSNLVFLLDVSGSMNSPNKLPLLKQSMCLLVNQLSAQDKVSIVVYAGSAGTVLPPTSGDKKAQIMKAIDRLEAGGSTAGGAGIQLAYKEAQKALIKGGNNRVILATDGDFNVGQSSDAALVRMIEQKRNQGIFLTVLGFGTGNYKDSKMEQLANKGNGNYAYIDTLSEANKVLVTDLRGTLFTIAKDVKIQVEFNPNKVQAYRLIGYENRALRDQDFNDDKKDAGEIGAGHRVTALYEVVPTGVKSNITIPSVDPLKYQKVDPPQVASNSDELMTVKLRYKAPDGDRSQLITQPVRDRVSASDKDLQFSSAVALFGMVLRDSEYKGDGSIADVLRLARAGQGADRNGYRSEFIRLVERYEQMRDQVAKR